MYVLWMPPWPIPECAVLMLMDKVHLLYNSKKKCRLCEWVFQCLLHSKYHIALRNIFEEQSFWNLILLSLHCYSISVSFTCKYWIIRRFIIITQFSYVIIKFLFYTVFHLYTLVLTTNWTVLLIYSLYKMYSHIESLYLLAK